MQTTSSILYLLQMQKKKNPTSVKMAIIQKLQHTPGNLKFYVYTRLCIP